MPGASPAILMRDDQGDGARACPDYGPRQGYPSGLTEDEWQVIAPHLPHQVPRAAGQARIWPVRRIIKAIMYLDRIGCAWRYLPDGFPPWPTVYGTSPAWRDDGTLGWLHEVLRAAVRAAGRNPGLSAVLGRASAPYRLRRRQVGVVGTTRAGRVGRRSQAVTGSRR
jgi:transposase